ncbi:hypothetical protein SAY87_024597 [Trapa incisa]|uniref:Uncharacterized protein n=1 Tax=Trapa incisa TaxID=236973 RepID=A0AAN7JF83_9MYRT|nr:hypothetical protein SAY87_024597 [Trapa incisa]
MAGGSITLLFEKWGKQPFNQLNSMIVYMTHCQNVSSSSIAILSLSNSSCACSTWKPYFQSCPSRCGLGPIRKTLRPFPYFPLVPRKPDAPSAPYGSNGEMWVNQSRQGMQLDIESSLKLSYKGI